MKKIRLFFTALMILVTGTALAQNIQVSGTVTEASGEAVPFASVHIKGTTNGVSSDTDGHYSITAAQNATIVFSYVG